MPSVKNWKAYLNLSTVILVVAFLLITVFAILYSSWLTWLIWLSTLLGMLSSKTNTEGKWITFIFDIISYGVYIYVCLLQRYYGELILSVIIILIHIFSLVEWKKNLTTDNIVVVNRLSKKELLVSLLIATVSTVIYALVLYFMQSAYPILNAIPTVIYLLGNYFVYKRSRLQFWGWIGYEIFFITLWILAALQGQDAGIIFLIGGISELVYGIIGLHAWKKLENKQSSTSKTN